jgi:hypothetical protein
VDLLEGESEVDRTKVTREVGWRQDFNDAADALNPAIPLSRPDRRLLLGASLRVLHDRFSHGRTILAADVLRVASLGDDARGWAA